MKKLSALALALLVSACSATDDLEKQEEFTTVREVTASFDGVSYSGEEVGPATKLITSYSSGIVSFEYEVGDAFGIFPEEGTPIQFASTSSGSSVSINAGAWKTKNEYSYVTYFPYSYSAFDKHALPFSYQGQVQDGNNRHSHLAKSLIMASSPTKAENDAFHADLDLVGGMMRLRMNIPSKACEVTKVVLKSSGPKFITKGTIDLFGRDAENNFPVAAAADGLSDEMVLTFKTPVSLTANQNLVTFWNVKAPATFAAGELTAYVYTTEGEVYAQTNPKDVVYQQDVLFGVILSDLQLSDSGILGPIIGTIE